MSRHHKSAALNFQKLLHDRQMTGGARTQQQRGQLLQEYNTMVDDLCECDEEQGRQRKPAANGAIEHCLHCTRRNIMKQKK